ncbi:MAG: DegT/DnrJ/EryC1/StrS family aminotransferase [Candidatus Omnitrophota bacterium]
MSFRSIFFGRVYIHSQIHYPKPVHKQEAFISMGDRESLPVTERLCEEILSLPMHPFLDDDEITKIVDAINDYDF